MRVRFEVAVLRGRWIILAAVAAATVLAGLSWSGLTIENNAETWFRGSGERYDRYRVYQDLFGTEETIFIAIGAEDVFTRDVLRRIDALTERLEADPAFDRVVSLTNIEHIEATPEAIEIGPLASDERIAGGDLETLRRDVLADRFYPRMIVSPDGRTTVVLATVIDLSAATTDRALRAAQSAADETLGDDLEFHLAGWLVVNEMMNRYAEKDQRRAIPLLSVLLGGCLLFFFRSVRAVFIAVGAVLLVIIWTMGVYTGTGLPGTLMAASTLPGILFALVFATAVHVIARFQEESAATADANEAMRRALRRVAPAVVLTSVTTAVGLGSLVVADLPPVRHLGAFAALGMAFTCIVALTVIPITLVSFRSSRMSRTPAWLVAALDRVADWNLRHPWRILTIAAAGAAFGLAGTLHLRPQGTNLNYLPRSSPALEAMRFIEERFSPAGGVEVLVSGERDALKQPEVARAVLRAQEAMEAHPEVSDAFSYTDLLRRMNEVVNDGDPNAYRIPDSFEAVAQLLFLYETSGGEELPEYVELSGYDRGRIIGRMTAFVAIEEWARLYESIERDFREIEADGPDGLRFEISGDSPLWLHMNLSLVGTMGRSFLIALAGVSLIMMALMRSVRLGLLAMIPNVFPVVVAIGSLGWLGVELDFATVMVAGIALGIAVDDTIHYLVRYQQELAAGDGDPAAAMRRTLRTVGRAMVTTSTVLTLGMGSMVLSYFPPHQTFAIAISMTMVLALLSDLFLLPVLLALAGGAVPHPSPPSEA